MGLAGAAAAAAFDSAVKGALGNATKWIEDKLHEQQRAQDAETVNLSGVSDTGVIRGDLACAAIHLYSARLMLKIVPEQWDYYLVSKIAGSLSSYLIKREAAKRLAKVPHISTILYLLSGLLGLPARLAVQRALEIDMRLESHVTRRSITTRRLNPRTHPKKARLVRDVQTRRKTARKHNRWKGCKSK